MMKTYSYTTSGTCARNIEIDIEDGKVADVRFDGGCHGNLQGITALVRGLTPAEVVPRLEGIRCKTKSTSCPDQLAQALKAIPA